MTITVNNESNIASALSTAYDISRMLDCTVQVIHGEDKQLISVSADKDNHIYSLKTSYEWKSMYHKLKEEYDKRKKEVLIPVVDVDNDLRYFVSGNDRDIKALHEAFVAVRKEFNEAYPPPEDIPDTVDVEDYFKTALLEYGFSVIEPNDKNVYRNIGNGQNREG